MQSIHLLQAQYWESGNSFKSAQLLIERKSRNMGCLLKQYLPFRQEHYPDQAKILSALINKIQSKTLQIPQTDTRQALMLVEAEISHLYWKGFALLCHCPTGWKRTYPHGQDAWNISLNIGYTMLSKFIAPKLAEHGLSLEIGILHSPQNGNEALVYDFQELFRQPLIDAALIPLFSKYRSFHVTNGKIVGSCSSLLAKQKYYKGQSVQPSTILDREAGCLVQAMVKKMYTYPTSTLGLTPKKRPEHKARAVNF